MIMLARGRALEDVCVRRAFMTALKAPLASFIYSKRTGTSIEYGISCGCVLCITLKQMKTVRNRALDVSSDAYIIQHVVLKTPPFSLSCAPTFLCSCVLDDAYCCTS